MKKTWTEKLADDKDLPKVERIPGKGKMAIASPREVDALMRKVPKGKVTTINELRAKIAKKHKADFACPITTGIFAWIAAHAAEEARECGEKAITPWWRTLKGEGELNPKYPGGVERQRKLLEAEGLVVNVKGKRFIVQR